jgi:hypothetical protein
MPLVGFSPEDGGCIFFRNVCKSLQVHAASQHKRWPWTGTHSRENLRSLLLGLQ